MLVHAKTFGSEADDSVKLKKPFQISQDAYKSKTFEAASKNYFAKFVNMLELKFI